MLDMHTCKCLAQLVYTYSHTMAGVKVMRYFGDFVSVMYGNGITIGVGFWVGLGEGYGHTI